MAAVTHVVVFSPRQHPLPTPSPFTNSSVASTGWSFRPSIYICNLFLRALVLLFSFVSAISLAAPSPNKKKGEAPFSFGHQPELRYCFAASSLASLYSAFQLFKGVCDIAHRGLLISDMVSDYMNFILDQLVCYLLLSSSSVSMTAIIRMDHGTSLWKASIVSVVMSFIAFLVLALCNLLSGYRLCKRFIW